MSPCKLRNLNPKDQSIPMTVTENDTPSPRPVSRHRSRVGQAKQRNFKQSTDRSELSDFNIQVTIPTEFIQRVPIRNEHRRLTVSSSSDRKTKASLDLKANLMMTQRMMYTNNTKLTKQMSSQSFLTPDQPMNGTKPGKNSSRNSSKNLVFSFN